MPCLPKLVNPGLVDEDVSIRIPAVRRGSLLPTGLVPRSESSAKRWDLGLLD